MAIIRLGSGRYRLQIRRKGIRVDEVYATEEKALAREREYLSGRRTGTTLEEAWALYLESPGFLQKRERTRNTEIGRIKRFLHAWGRKPVHALESGDIEQYIAKRLKEKPQPSADAVRLEVAALSALMNFCRRRQLLPANPCRGVQRPAAAIKPRRMTQDEHGALTALLRHPNFRFRSAARLCLLVRETGARPGEWQSVMMQDINLDKQRVVFQTTKYRSQPRTVPLTKTAARLVGEQIADLATVDFELALVADLLFPAEGKDGRLSPLHYTGALRDAKKKGLLPKSVKAHTGRHEFISELVESTDMDDSRIMALVGHHSPVSMEAYKHVRNVRLLPQIESIEDKRREERTRALARTLGVPPQVITSLLQHTRNADEGRGLEDDGEELLYTKEILDRLGSFVDRLGQTPEDRYSTLARMLMARRGEGARMEPSVPAATDESPVSRLASATVRSPKAHHRAKTSRRR